MDISGSTNYYYYCSAATFAAYSFCFTNSEDPQSYHSGTKMVHRECHLHLF